MATGGTIQGNTFTFGAGASSGGGGLFGPGGIFGTSGPAAQSATSGPAAPTVGWAPTSYYLSITLGEQVKVKTLVAGGVKIVSGPGECKILGTVEGVVVEKLQPDAVVPEIILNPSETKLTGDWSMLEMQCDMVAIDKDLKSYMLQVLEPLLKKARNEK